MTTKRERLAVATAEQRPAPVTLYMDPAHKRVRVRDLFKEMTGTDPSPPTVWRVVRGKGATGVRLPAVQLANAWYTTREAWTEWLELRSRIKLGMPIDASPAELADVGL